MVWPEFYSQANIRMGVPIGDVARVSQVLLAQLQQSRTTAEDRTTPGLITSESVNTTAVQSSGNVETQTGFFLGDAGLLSNVNVGLQRVTDIGNVTTNTITTHQNVNALNTLETDAINILPYKSILVEEDFGQYEQLENKTINYFNTSDDGETVFVMTSSVSIVVKNGNYYTLPGGQSGELSSNGNVILINNVIYRYSNNAWNNEYTIGNNTSRWAMSSNGNYVVGADPSSTYIYNGVAYYFNSGIVYQYAYNGNSWYQQRSFRSYDPPQPGDLGSTTLAVSNNGVYVVASFRHVQSHIFQNGVTFDYGTDLTVFFTLNDYGAHRIRCYISDDANTLILRNTLFTYTGAPRMANQVTWGEILNDVVNNISPNNLFIARNTQALAYYERINGTLTVTPVVDSYKGINTTFVKTAIASDPLYFLGITSDGKITRIKYQDDVQYKLNVSGDAIIENLTTDYIFSDYFDGDGGGLSNLSSQITLQEVTDYGNITNQLIVNTNQTRSQFNYSPTVINGLILPKYLALKNEINYDLSGYTAISSDSDGTTIVLNYRTYFRTLLIDQNDNSTILSSFDVSHTELFGSYLKLSSNGLKLLINTSTRRVRLYTRGHITSTGWTFVASVYDNYGDHPYLNNSIGFGTSIDTDDNITKLVVGCPNFNQVTYYGPNTAVLGNTNIGIVKTYNVSNTAFSFIKNITGPGTSGAEFGRNVCMSRDGSKIILNNAIYNFTGGWIRDVGRESGGMKLSNDGTVVIVSNKLHKYSGSSWTYDILSDVRDITSSLSTFKASGMDIIKYDYNSGTTWTSNVAYSTSTIGNINFTSANGSKVITTNDNKLSIVDILDGEPYSITGDVNISGTLTKASGTFKIEHPLETMKNTHTLTHSFIEGPKADLIYRGKAQLSNGTVNVNIDEVSKMTEGTFEALTRDTQCFVSNETDWDGVRGVINGNLLTVQCQNTASNAMISWMVIGERKDRHMYTLDWTDNDGRVVPEKLKM